MDAGVRQLDRSQVADELVDELIELEVEEMLDLGCNGFIQKPFDIIELSRTLRDIFDRE